MAGAFPDDVGAGAGAEGTDTFGAGSVYQQMLFIQAASRYPMVPPGAATSQRVPTCLMSETSWPALSLVWNAMPLCSLKSLAALPKEHLPPSAWANALVDMKTNQNQAIKSDMLFILEPEFQVRRAELNAR